MKNFFASCGLCSDAPQSGEYAYEAYDKIKSNQLPQDHQ